MPKAQDHEPTLNSLMYNAQQPQPQKPKQNAGEPYLEPYCSRAQNLPELCEGPYRKTFQEPNAQS